MPRKAKQSIRSGKFTTDAVLQIIRGSAGGAQYRIYNAKQIPDAGRDEFTVTVTGGPGAGSFPVAATCSLDVNVQNAATTVTITPNMADEKAVGAFDLIQANSESRSGRFQFDGTIILKTVGLYRVINTGDNPITLDGVIAIPAGGGNPAVPAVVAKGCSLDFTVANGSTISVSPTAVKGVYDRLDTLSEVRSGRFSQQMPDANPPVTPVLNFRANVASLGAQQRYRIANSGLKSFTVQSSNDGTSWTDIATLSRGQSIDIPLPVSNTQKVIGVVGGVGDLIEGVIDYLGPAQ